jgi:hypothetical protein
MQQCRCILSWVRSLWLKKIMLNMLHVKRNFHQTVFSITNGISSPVRVATCSGVERKRSLRGSSSSFEKTEAVKRQQARAIKYRIILYLPINPKKFVTILKRWMILKMSFTK